MTAGQLGSAVVEAVHEAQWRGMREEESIYTYPERDASSLSVSLSLTSHGTT